MDNQRTTIMGIFSDENQAAAAIRKLKDASYTVERVHSPIPSHAIANALQLPKSKVGWFTLCGGIIGFFSGFLLAAFTATRWNLIVGGKPVVALVPFVIVGFEFTILFAVFGNILGLISQARLPRFNGRCGRRRLRSCHSGSRAAAPAPIPAVPGWLRSEYDDRFRIQYRQ